jgi:hypothetical protein
MESILEKSLVFKLKKILKVKRKISLKELTEIISEVKIRFSKIIFLSSSFGPPCAKTFRPGWIFGSS